MEYFVDDWTLAIKSNAEKNCGSEVGYFSIDRSRGRNYSKGEDDYIERYVIVFDVRTWEYSCFNNLYYRFGILAKKDKDGKYIKCDEDFYIELPREVENKPDFDIKMEEAIRNLNNSSEYKSKKWSMGYYVRGCDDKIWEEISYKPFLASYAHSSCVKNKTLCTDVGIIILNKQYVIQTITHSELSEESIDESNGEGKWNNYYHIVIKNTNTGEVKTESFFKQEWAWLSKKKIPSIKAKLIEGSIESEV